MTTETLIDKRAFSWKPGENGRPPNYGSITYWLKRLLAEKDDKTGEYHAQILARKAIEMGENGSLAHYNLVIDRTDGAIASEINVKGVFLHVGDEYATQGLAAMRSDIATKQLEASQMPQISNSSPVNNEMGIQLPPAGTDPIKTDE